MVEDEEGLRAVARRRCSKQTPETMRVVRRVSDTREKKKAERLDESAEMEAREGDLSYVSRMAAVEKLRSVQKEPKK